MSALPALDRLASGYQIVALDLARRGRFSDAGAPSLIAGYQGARPKPERSPKG